MAIVRFWNMKDSNTDDNNFTPSRNPRVNSIGRILNECIIPAERAPLVLLSSVFNLMLLYNTGGTLLFLE